MTHWRCHPFQAEIGVRCSVNSYKKRWASQFSLSLSLSLVAKDTKSPLVMWMERTNEQFKNRRSSWLLLDWRIYSSTGVRHAFACPSKINGANKAVKVLTSFWRVAFCVPLPSHQTISHRWHSSSQWLCYMKTGYNFFNRRYFMNAIRQ